ncbi:MAG: hypothetical protein NZU63_08060 [Gemmataceae bacterium]|nr:hypothetical protein [Gemmataceae bacterium]
MVAVQDAAMKEGGTVRQLLCTSVMLPGLLMLSLSSKQLAPAQQVQPKQLPKPQAIFKELREFVAEGRYSLAIQHLKDFLESKPEPQDYIAIYDRYGPDAFTFLYRVPRWSDNPVEHKMAREYVERIVTQANAALDQHIRNPQRIAKYVSNLGATPEERQFAQAELVRIGAAAVPYMVEQLRTDKEPAVIEGIYGTIPRMDPESVAAWIAALDGLRPQHQYAVISALVRHEQFLPLQQDVQTSILPVLWRSVLLGNKTLAELRQLAEGVLRDYLRPSGIPLEKRAADRELLQLARQFYDGQPRYRLLKKLPDAEATVRIWRWLAGEEKLRSQEVPLSWANEYYGLRYARWVAESDGAAAEEAQILILSLISKFATLRSQFGDLAVHEPEALRLLLVAPPALREEALRQALRQKQTATLVALLQAAQVRADRELAAAAAGRTESGISLLEVALDYPDPLVQFLAADALIRGPFPLQPVARSKIIDILRRQLHDAHLPPPPAPGTALYLDADGRRRDALLPILLAAGFRVETYSTGRELLQRLQRGTADFLLIDHHAVNPQLRDLISQLQTDSRWAAIPTLVLASPEQPSPPTLEQLLLRTAVLMAATDQRLPDVPDAYVPHPNDPPEQQQRLRRENQTARDNALLRAANERRTRLLQIVNTLPLFLTQSQRELLELRLDIINYAVLAQQFTISTQTAPQTVLRIQDLQRRLALAPPLPTPDTRLAVEELMRLLQRLEVDVDRVPAARARFEQLYFQIDPESLGLPVARYRDPEREAQLRQLLRYFPQVVVVPMPASALEIRDQWLPRWQTTTVQRTADPEFKRAARLRAVTALTQFAQCPETTRQVIPAIPALLLCLGDDQLAPVAADALLHLPDPAIQPALVALARNPQRPLPLRQQAADNALRHAQRFSPTLPADQLEPLRQTVQNENDPVLRLRLLTYLSLLSPDPMGYRRQLVDYAPPDPSPRKKEPPAAPSDKKDVQP